jgi:hypothetical protein
MIVKLLGGFDLIAVIIIFFSAIFPQKLILYAAGYLLFKGIIFAMGGDIASIIDVLCGVYVVLLSYGISSTLVTVIVLVYLVQKVAFSLFA